MARPISFEMEFEQFLTSFASITKNFSSYFDISTLKELQKMDQNSLEPSKIKKALTKILTQTELFLSIEILAFLDLTYIDLTGDQKFNQKNQNIFYEISELQIQPKKPK